MHARLHLIAGLVLCASITQASATIFTETYLGTVTAGEDTKNLFGGGNLTGDFYTAVFMFDTSLGNFDFPNVNYTDLNNGLVSFSVDIGGHIFAGPAPSQGPVIDITSINGPNGGGLASYISAQEDVAPHLFASDNFASVSPLIGPSFAPFSSSDGSGTGALIDPDQTSAYVDASISSASLTTPPSCFRNGCLPTVTPLPDALPLFATGLAAFCLFGRRKRRVARS